MSSFHARITPDEAEGILRCAKTAGFLERDHNSLIVHDLERMGRRIDTLTDVFPTGTLHAIAIKANPVVEVLRAATKRGAGLEAASLEELYLALAADCPPHRIVFDSPAKTTAELATALSYGVNINVDNFAELSRVADLTGSSTPTSLIGLRINPEVGSGTISDTSVAHAGSKFGVSISRDRQQIVEAFSEHRWLSGLHVHVGSQGCGLDLLCNAAVKLQAFRQEIESRTARPISTLNIGGGLPAAYREHDHPPDPAQYVSELENKVPELLSSDAQLVTEFGRAVQAGCGIAFSRVEYVRSEANGPTMAVIHLGADFLLRPVYRPTDWSHEFLLFDRQGKLKTENPTSVTIGGPLCFAGDIVAREITMARPAPGDWIAIRDCGAYTLSMWSRHCSRGIPVVLGYRGADNLQLLRPAESPDDVVGYWSSSPSGNAKFGDLRRSSATTAISND